MELGSSVPRCGVVICLETGEEGWERGVVGEVFGCYFGHGDCWMEEIIFPETGNPRRFAVQWIIVRLSETTC